MNPSHALAFSFVLVFFVACRTPAGPGSRHEPIRPLDRFLQAPSPALETVLADPESFRFQILISEVVPTRSGHPRLVRYGYRVDAEYFYPASSIKLCAAVAALQHLERMFPSTTDIEPAEVPIEFDPLFPGDLPQLLDLEPASGPTPRPITIGREIRKLALVSDNQAFNRLFDWVGHDELNRAMHALGLASVVLNHRLSDPRAIPDPSVSAGVVFRPANAPEIRLEPRKSSLRLANQRPGLQIGRGYLAGSTLVEKPMDFTMRNGVSLVDLQNQLVQVVRPEIDLELPVLRLRPSHRALLVDALTRYPRESTDPRYPESEFPDHYGKFLLPGVRRVFPDSTPGHRIEITGKVGRAYGFSVENASLTRPDTGEAVFVTAVVYTNADGILNDDRYEYAEIADPLFEELGERIAKHWLSRPNRSTGP